MVRRARWLFRIRWVAIFLTGWATISWPLIVARSSFWVSAAMGVCWGIGVARMSSWDRHRVQRKLLDRLAAETDALRAKFEAQLDKPAE